MGRGLSALPQDRTPPRPASALKASSPHLPSLEKNHAGAHGEREGERKIEGRKGGEGTKRRGRREEEGKDEKVKERRGSEGPVNAACRRDVICVCSDKFCLKCTG